MAAIPVYRAPMRSRDDSVPSGLAVERALTRGLCGVGGRLETIPDSLTAAAGVVAADHDERVAARLERFAAAPDGSFVWTRDADGLFWLGRIIGPWYYDAAPEATAADLVHVRPCAWCEAPIRDVQVPSAVRATFARGGRNWQRIHSSSVSEQTQRLWELRQG